MLKKDFFLLHLQWSFNWFSITYCHSPQSGAIASPRLYLTMSADIFFHCYNFGGGVLLASNGHRPGILVNLQCTGQPPKQRILNLPIAIAPSLINSDLEPSLSKVPRSKQNNRINIVHLQKSPFFTCRLEVNWGRRGKSLHCIQSKYR